MCELPQHYCFSSDKRLGDGFHSYHALGFPDLYGFRYSYIMNSSFHTQEVCHTEVWKPTALWLLSSDKRRGDGGSCSLWSSLMHIDWDTTTWPSFHGHSRGLHYVGQTYVWTLTAPKYCGYYCSVIGKEVIEAQVDLSLTPKQMSRCFIRFSTHFQDYDNRWTEGRGKMDIRGRVRWTKGEGKWKKHLWNITTNPIFSC